jgi:hypothetical protein
MSSNEVILVAPQDRKKSYGGPEAWWPGTAGLVIDFEVVLHLLALDLSGDQRLDQGPLNVSVCRAL